MGDAGIGQHPLDVGLDQGHNVAQHQCGDAEHQEDRGPVGLKPAQSFGENAEKSAETGGLRGHGHEGRDGCRSALVDVRRPHVKRDDGEFEGESDRQQDRGEQEQRIIQASADHSVGDGWQAGAAGGAIEQGDTVQQDA